MRAGNTVYSGKADIAEIVPVFPLSGALLLPGARIPLNIFEPRYLQMVDDAMRGDRLIAMIQPHFDGHINAAGEPALCEVGCLGRITSFTETGDGRYLVSLDGICRFRVSEEIKARTPYRKCRIMPFINDLEEENGADVDREALLKAFRSYLDANSMEADWESVRKAENDTLVNALSMMSPYGPAEKQALLEAPDLKTRAETLIAITEIALARAGDDSMTGLQ